MLLIHGYTATTAEVRPLARDLHQQGYTVAGPLLPGHNTQPEDANRYRWRDWVRAVEESYQQLAARCQRVVVGGESTGALLALYLASEHPEAAAILAYAPALKLKMGPRQIALIRVLAPFVPYIRKQEMGDDPLWQGYPVYPAEGAPASFCACNGMCAAPNADQPADPDRARPARCNRCAERSGDRAPRNPLGGQGIALDARLTALRHHRPGARAGEPAHAGLSSGAWAHRDANGRAERHRLATDAVLRVHRQGLN